MLKELFLAVFLSSSIGVSSVGSNTDTTRFLNGFYCFRQNFSYESTFNLSFSNSGALTGDVYKETLKYYDYTYNTYESYPFTLNIEYNYENDYIYLDFTDDNQGQITYDSSDFYTSYNGVNNLSDFFKYFVLYFDSPTYISSTDYEAFISLFDTSNEYCYAYSGYYHLNNVNNFNGVSMFSIYGVITLDNELYKGISLTNISDLYDTNHKFSGLNQNAYFTYVLLPTPLYNTLDNLGDFQFIQDTSQSSFADLFFSVADTPLYFIYNLFNFDIFGVSLFVAFTSLITIMLFVIIIKKLV